MTISQPTPALDPDAVVTVSSGNVFTDLGLPPGEAAVMGLRADLMGRLRLLVQTEGWTQAQAAERFCIAQSRVSDLLRGKWDKSSLDRLMTLATRAGRHDSGRYLGLDRPLARR
jgi:predicted XRE-type DNA-binding protein